MDGAGRNSPFASALLRHIGEPGQSINDLMIAVRRDVVSETHDTQRPWEQGSLLERFEFVPSGQAAMPSTPTVSAPTGAQTQVAALERSVGDSKSVENFLVGEYLAPDGDAIREAVKRVYAPSVKIFGSELDNDAIVKLKTDWFAQFTSWSLQLEPGSLVVTPRGENRADAVFAMTYDYTPKDGSAAHLAGKARVSLELVMSDGEWRVSSETLEAR